MKAAVLGCTGYIGMNILPLLGAHPAIESILPVSSSQAGESLIEADPGIGDQVLAKCAGTNGRMVDIAAAASAKPDVVFAALPHLKSAELCEPFFGKCVLLDLSADFRMQTAVDFRQSYKHDWPRPDLQDSAVYGLSEIHAERIRKADLIACPGCYPTATLLPLVPLVRDGIVAGRLVVNAMSGVSGAGRKLSRNYLYCERNENAGAYLPGKSHRHTLEIAQSLPGCDLFFTPHIVPLQRGMAITTMADLGSDCSADDAYASLTAAYADKPFIRLLRGSIPETRFVRGTNRCDIACVQEGGSLYLFSAIDNLIKGAGGQAVQNMNLRFGFDVRAGLTTQNAF